jgi:hypothetical protein
MPEQFSYIRHSVDTVDALRSMHIQDMEKGLPIDRGSQLMVFPLGKVILNGAKLHLALKTHETRKNTTTRALVELTNIETVLRHVPEFRPFFANFVGLIAVDETTNVVGIITEDATRGDVLPIKGMQASEDKQQLLEERFVNKDEVLWNDCLESVAFNVDGQERWLDLGTPLFEISNHQDYDYANRSVENLTIVIPQDSELGEWF